MESFSDLLRRASDGSPAAAETLFCRYVGPLMGAARRRLSPSLRRRYDTLDLTQSVFADVLRTLPRFEDRGESAFRHWLYLKLENKVRDKLRRCLGPAARRREVTLETPDGVLDHRDPDAPEGPKAAARDLISTLPAEQSDLVRLRLEEGLSFGEIADRLGLSSPDAARKRFSRSMTILRRVATDGKNR